MSLRFLALDLDFCGNFNGEIALSVRASPRTDADCAVWRVVDGAERAHIIGQKRRDFHARKPRGKRLNARKSVKKPFGNASHHIVIMASRILLPILAERGFPVLHERIIRRMFFSQNVARNEMIQSKMIRRLNYIRQRHFARLERAVGFQRLFERIFHIAFCLLGNDSPEKRERLCRCADFLRFIAKNRIEKSVLSLFQKTSVVILLNRFSFCAVIFCVGILIEDLGKF